MQLANQGGQAFSQDLWVANYDKVIKSHNHTTLLCSKINPGRKKKAPLDHLCRALLSYQPQAWISPHLFLLCVAAGYTRLLLVWVCMSTWMRLWEEPWPPVITVERRAVREDGGRLQLPSEFITQATLGTLEMWQQEEQEATKWFQRGM